MKQILTTIAIFCVLGLSAQVNENFETDDGGWVSSNDIGDLIFEWGAPIGSQIDDDYDGGGNAWVTELDGTFNITSFDGLTLNSPAYDLSELTSGNVTFAINYDLYYNSTWDEYDGVQLLYSTDSSDWVPLGSEGSGTNWYNGFSFSVGDSWVGNSGGWVLASHEIPSDLLGQSSAYFLFVLPSGVESGSYGHEGFALDNFTISDQSIDSDFLTMSIPEEVSGASIDAGSKTVQLIVSPTTDVTNLSPVFTISDGATIDKASGSTFDFSSPVTYTITAENTSFSSVWTVSVVNPEFDISLFPKSGIPGTYVSIYGNGFSTNASDNVLKIGGEPVDIISASANKLTIQIPSGLNLGRNEVTIADNSIGSFRNNVFDVLLADEPRFIDEYRESDFNFNVTVVYSMDVGDIDLDGDVDIVFDDSGNLKIATLENGRVASISTVVTSRNGSQSFADFVFSDINNDGYPDIVAGGDRLGWFENIGDGTFADEAVISSSNSNYKIRVFDADGDFDQDVVASFNSGNAVYKNSGGGSFTESSGTSRLGTPIDWDEDGDIDMIAPNGSGERILMLKNDGSGSFSNSAIVTGLSDVDFVQVGDLDNDLDLDLVFTTYSSATTTSTVEYLLNDGLGSFGSSVTIVTEGDAQTEQMELADLDGDGFPDIIREKTNGIEGTLQSYVQDGALNFNIVTTVESASEGMDLVVVDIDQDGDLDLLQEASQSGGYYPLFINYLGSSNISSVTFPESTGNISIDEANKSITVEVESDSEVSSLIPTLVLSSSASSSPESGVAQDFTNTQTYTVTAEDGTTSVWTVSVIKVPVTPQLTGLTDYVGQTSVLLNWVEVEGSSYEIELSESNDFDSLFVGFPLSLDNSTDTSLTISSLTEATIYYSRIRALNSFGSYSEYSETISFLTIPATPISNAASDIAETSFMANWDTVSGAELYYVEISSDGFTTLDFSDSIAVNKLSATGLSNGTNYEYRVSAVNSTGFSPASNVIEVLTKPGAPLIADVESSDIDQTSVDISWTAPGGDVIEYLIDLSTTDVGSDTTLVSGYPVSVSTTSTTLSSLESGTDYWLLIRAKNESGESEYSNVVRILTIPEDPVASVSTDVLTTSFTANWSEVSGANGYNLIVINNSNSITILNDSTTENNYFVEELVAGTQYRYDVRAYNETGASSFSNGIFVTMNRIPTSIELDNKFVEENLAIGSTIDILKSIDPDDSNGDGNFTYSFVDGDNDNASFQIVQDTLKTGEILDFESKSLYNIDIQTDDGAGGVLQTTFQITIIDVNEAPTEISLSFPSRTIVGYDSTGTLVGTLLAEDDDSGDTEFTFELVTGSEIFDVEVDDEVRNIQIIETEVDSTITITVRATDEGGASITTDIDILVSAFIDTFDPIFDISGNSQVFLSGGDPVTIQTELTEFRIDEVRFYKKLFTEAEFTSQVISSNSNTYEVMIQEEDLGVAGIEYYFEGIDAEGNVGVSDRRTLVLSFAGGTAASPIVESVQRFGRTVDNYQILSVPFQFEGTGNRVNEIFDEYGNPDNRTWRMIRFDNVNDSLINLTGTSSINLGEAYFFIAVEQKEITVGAASINLQDPYPIELKAGWNLIGNPYNLDIDWTSVLDNNSANSIVGPLRVLDPNNNQTWPTSTVLRKFEGAFVQVSEDVTLNISYADVILSLGRMEKYTEEETPNVNWYLPITLKQDDEYRTAGIGMDVKAHETFDRLDRLQLPRWFEYLEFNSMHESERFKKFNRDIVPLTDRYIWDIQVSSSTVGASTLIWDHEDFGSGYLKLLDKSTGRVIDMNETSTMQLYMDGVTELRIMYSTDPNDSFEFDKVSVMAAYPNPMDHTMYVPVSLPTTETTYNIGMEIIDLSGKQVYSNQKYKIEGGNYQFEITPEKQIPAGMYLYKLSVISDGKENVYTQRISVK